MKKISLFFAASLGLMLAGSAASAMSIDWTGVYRVEFNQISRPSLGSPQDTKYYGLNYLSLSPKIIAADGINIISKFDVLGDQGAYSNSQTGQIWGSNSNVGTSSGTSSINSRNQGASNLKVSQLYLNVNQEYGALIVGRAPFHFGLGMTYNSGEGLFDHWYQTRDMVAYKFIVGDWSFMPMSARTYSRDASLGNSVNELAIQVMYENKDTRSMLGVLQATRKGANTVNDAMSVAPGTANPLGPDVANTPVGDLNTQRTNFFFGRDWDSFGFRFEAGFESGETGFQTTTAAGAQGVSVTAYGLAADFYFPHGESKWDYKIRTGFATGDNPDTPAYEGFQFDPNYDVGLLLFNHRLGKKDFLTTNRMKDNTLTDYNSLDDESVGNTIFIAPSITYSWNDRLDLRNTFVYAELLNRQKNSVDAKKDLGVEWDIELIYKPVEKIQWINQVGFLLPGAAWKNGSDPTNGSFDNGFTYGFVSKAAISF